VIRAVKIELERCEGATTEVGSHTFTPLEGASVWSQATEQIIAWRWSSPANGGYHKVAFVVTWEDGETYSGRYDLKRHHVGTLGEQISYHLRWLSTVGRDYARKSADYAVAFLAKGYEMGEDGCKNEARP
jgi:hypothetical protein